MTVSMCGSVDMTAVLLPAMVPLSKWKTVISRQGHVYCSAVLQLGWKTQFCRRLSGMRIDGVLKK